MKRWAELAARGVLGPVTRFADQQEIFPEGGAADVVCFLIDGAVEFFHPSAPAAPAFRILATPSLFGQGEALGGEASYLASARALGTARIHLVARDTFVALLEADSTAAKECLVATTEALCVNVRLAKGSTHESEARLAALMLAYAEVLGRPKGVSTVIPLRRSQADLARCVGGSERQVNRIIKGWKQRGWLTKLLGQYVILQQSALLQVSGPLGRLGVSRAGMR